MRTFAAGRWAPAVVAALISTGPLSAQLVVGATDGFINSGGPGVGLLSETWDQSGLTLGYTSGVTNWDSYFASNPEHTELFAGNEWFSESGISSASVTYDLGSVMSIYRMALWNEESSGIGLLDLYGSVNGVDFFALSLGLTPTDWPLSGPDALDFYPADIFTWTATDLRYVRMDMSRCPQPDPADYPGCSIGEVAFGTGTDVVPEPTTVVLLGTGLLGIAVLARRRRDELEEA
jgi:hypothetical protein